MLPDTVKGLVDLMEGIGYGHPHQGEILKPGDPRLPGVYRLQSPDELMVTRVGLCGDHAELQRWWLEFNDARMVEVHFVGVGDRGAMGNHVITMFILGGRRWRVESVMEPWGPRRVSSIHSEVANVTAALGGYNTPTLAQHGIYHRAVVRAPKYGCAMNEYLDHIDRSPEWYDWECVLRHALGNLVRSQED